jgi:hypothetical protein
MLKPVITATALLALAGGSNVYAQQSFGDCRFGDRQRAEFHHRPSAADVSAFADARIAALKAGLELTPDQAKNWPPFEQALRDMVQLRLQRIQAREAGNEQAPASPFERLARRADDMAKRSTALKKIADAGAPLYQSLDEEQKGRPSCTASGAAAKATGTAGAMTASASTRSSTRSRRMAGKGQTSEL